MTVYANPGADGAGVDFKKRYDHFIGGRWGAPKKGEYFENVTPITGQVFCEVSRGTAKDIEAAWAAAPKWNKASTTKRANLLLISATA